MLLFNYYCYYVIRCSETKTLFFSIGFSAYQVIVLKVVNDDEVLSTEDASKLKDANSASESNLNFYIAAEINNDPVHERPWEFTVGDNKNIGAYVNSALQKGQVYIVYQRAITPANNVSKLVFIGHYIKI